MKKLFPLFFFIGITFIARSQVRVGILGGANRSTILETNNIPGWDSTTKKNYSPLYSWHGGMFADIPLTKKGNFSFQPSVIYYNKGRKYLQNFDTTTSLRKDSSFKQELNYIDIPLNLLVKFRLAKKVKFFLGGGPYASFFFKGSEKSVTNFKDGTVVSTSNTDLPVGKAPGKYTTLDYGVNVTAGFEIGHVILKADASQSLTDMYQASNYKGTFKNQVISVSLGVSMDIKSPAPEKKKQKDTTATKPKTQKAPKAVKDKDNDGIADKDDKCPTEFGTKETMGCPDRDGDGVADKDDKCPDVKGTAANHGCPVNVVDTDGDGVPDELDKCPLVKGDPNNNGCPLKGVDTDGDGVNDDVDQCPTVVGLLRYHGCPIPDTDGDGVNDEIDHCKDVPGTAANHGCPENAKTTNPEVTTTNVTEEMTKTVNEAANKVLFKQSQSDLSPESKSALDAIAAVLQSNPSLHLKIEGHASKEGEHFINMGLSNSRANAVRDYLVSKGIDKARFAVAYFGSDVPVTNDPAKQAMNRRVEMKLY